METFALVAFYRNVNILTTMSDVLFVEPMPCLAVQKLPEGEAWQYELKLDGYRALAVKRKGRVTLFSRNRKRFDGRFPAVAAAFARLPDETIIDGEIVAIDETGRPSFSRLQNFSANADAITFYAFDMPMWKGNDLRMQPLAKRRELLRRKAMPKLPAIRFSDSFAADAEKMISAVRSQGLEGIVAKRRDSLYEPGRNGAWLKMRIGGGQEFVSAVSRRARKTSMRFSSDISRGTTFYSQGACVMVLSRRCEPPCSENLKVSKLADARLRICRKARKGVGVRG